MKKTFTDITLPLFILGLFLFLINFYGLFTSLRAPNLAKDLNRIRSGDITLTEAQVYAVLDSDTTDRAAYVTRAADAIHNGIGHYWEDDAIERFNLRVPIQENYILFLAGIVMPDKFQKYEFLDYHRAIERGVGMCSQHAIIFAEALHQRGIKTKMLGLSGHVVAMVQIDDQSGKWWVVDPDYNVIIREDISAIEKNPKLIEPYYLAAGYSMEAIQSLESIYQKSGNFIGSGYGIGNYSRLRNYFEQAAYILIWLIPALLILPFLILKLKTRTR